MQHISASLINEGFAAAMCFMWGRIYLVWYVIIIINVTKLSVSFPYVQGKIRFSGEMCSSLNLSCIRIATDLKRVSFEYVIANDESACAVTPPPPPLQMATSS